MTPTRMPALTLALLAATPALAVDLKLDLLNAYTSMPSNSSEILAYTPDQNTVLATVGNASTKGIEVLTLGSTGSLSSRGTINFGTSFGAIGVKDATSTAVDPLGRGFGVVTLVPTTNGTTAGKIGFFDYRNGSVGSLQVLDVGFHPDSVKFSADGTKLYVVNEGEFTSGGGTDAPGSISIIDLSGINSAGDVATLTNSAVATYDFQAANLGSGVNLNGLRINDTSAAAQAARYRHVEPEYLSEANGKLYVSLQENNAIGEFDLATGKWTAIRPLGTITQSIDASNTDGAFGGGADLVAGMPMPDTIATFQHNGHTYVVTANEGDFRPDDNDRIAVSSGSYVVDPAVAATLNSAYAGNFKAGNALGNLRVSRLDGDTNGDGDIDVITMAGTRSFSIWDASTGALVKDSGSLEQILLTLDPTAHNINFTGATDARSRDKGPEPEALELAAIDGNQFLFVGMERQGGIMAYLLNDPTNPELLDYINIRAAGLVAPESLLFISAANSPTGGNLLLGGYEGIDGLSNFGIGVFSVTAVPVPAALPLLASALGLFGFLRRRGHTGPH